MHNNINEFLPGFFTIRELQQITEYLDKIRLSQIGEQNVIAIFAFAKQDGKELKEVIRACETEWDRTWQYQCSAKRGDTDIVGRDGIANKASVNEICNTLGFPIVSKIAKKPESQLTATN